VHVSLSEVLGTMTGACGPYNLGGSATYRKAFGKVANFPKGSGAHLVGALAHTSRRTKTLSSYGEAYGGIPYSPHAQGLLSGTNIMVPMRQELKDISLSPPKIIVSRATA
jgi:hypothetical protein